MAEEDIWDSWEDFTDCGDVDKHVEQRLNMTSNLKTENGYVGGHGTGEKCSHSRTDNDEHIEKRSLSPRSGIRILQRPAIVNEEDENRTAYAPQLKILKRPEKSLNDVSDATKTNGQQPVKTLAQREAAYAEARQRIMGLEKQSSPQTNGRHNPERSENVKHASSKQNKGNYNNGTEGHPKRQSKNKGHSNGNRNKKR